MQSEDITPHLNKIATLYLKNNKRKVGWIYLTEVEESSVIMEQIQFISVQKGKKMIQELESQNIKALEPFSESIPLDLIERVRSSK